jgi:hypothetical protein
MVDPIVVVVGLIMFAAGFVLGAYWRGPGRRERPALALPDEP